MQTRTKLLLAGAAVAAAAAAIPTVAGATSDADPEVPITGPALEQASETAIAHMGGGTVTETEVGDEESYYEVEVTMDDGRQVDVQLDEQFNVVGTEDDGTEDDDSDG